MAEANFDVSINVKLSSKDETLKSQIKETDSFISRMIKNWKDTVVVFAMGYASVVSILSVMRAISNEVRNAFFYSKDFEDQMMRIAGLLTSMSGEKENLGKVFENAYRWSSLVYEKALELDPQFIGTAKELLDTYEAMASRGVLINVLRHEELDLWLAISTAAKVLTQDINKQKQLYQEVRAFLEGTARVGSTLAMVAKATNAELYEQMLYETDIEKKKQIILQMFSGYLEMSKHVNTTWTAITSTLDTLHQKVLRAGISVTFEKIKSVLSSISEEIGKNKSISDKLAESINKIALSIYGVLESSYNLVKPFSWVLPIIEKISEGLGLIAYTIIPTITKSFSDFVNKIVMVRVPLQTLAVAMYDLMTGSFKQGLDDLKVFKKDVENYWNDLTKWADKAGDNMMDNFLKRYDEFKGQIQKPMRPPEIPKLKPFEEEPAIDNKALEEFLRVFKFYMDERMKLVLNEREYEKYQLEQRYIDEINKLEGHNNLRKLLFEQMRYALSEIDKKYAEQDEDTMKWLLAQAKGTLDAEYEYKKYIELKELEDKTKFIDDEIAKEQARANIIKRLDNELMIEKIKNENRLAEASSRYRIAEYEMQEAFIVDNKERIALLEKQRAEYQTLLNILFQEYKVLSEIRDVAPEAWFETANQIKDVATKIRSIDEELLESSDNWSMGIRRAFEEYERSLSGFRQAYSTTNSIISAMQRGLEEFFDYTSERFLNWRDLILDILHQIYIELLRTFIIAPFIQGLKGIVMMPMMAPAQPATPAPVTVPPPEVGFASKPSPKVTVNIHNNTSYRMTSENVSTTFDSENYIVNVVMKNIDKNSPLRYMIKGVK